MPQHARGILALLVVTLVWGTTFPAMKDMTDSLSANWIVVSRFAIAGVLLSPFLWRARWRDLHYGFLAGGLLFFCYLAQVEGLSLTSSNRNAFICGLNVLVVPLLGIAMGRWPDRRIVLALLLAVAGLFALCWEGSFSWSRGDWLALTAAFLFGLYIKVMEQFSRKVERLMTLTVAQIWTVALFAGLWILLREVPRGVIDVPHDAADYYTYIWTELVAFKWNVLYLGLVATAAIISLQTWGQRHATANEAAVIYAFEPGAAAIFGYVWLGEVMGPMQLVGAALLISGMIVSQWNTPERPTTALVPE
ncbi:EamA family transporter [Pseudoduganella sp. DS3]|uniref:EamA family transporter n=1 Tax=Pseudoduganella guangdongensis TaxID=2692179 RepID=A0A6N9HAR3_9BURK|nr:DMT family transporter [Pseudoduganella guangdongensis]MYN00526.1 EamA family transporter [Pseudoduganella guangdongensis]